MASYAPFWLNWTPDALARLDARWQAAATAAAMKNPWQNCLIGYDVAGQTQFARVPGVIRIEKLEQKLSVMNNKKSGADGGRPLIRGRENPDFIIHSELHCPQHWKDWQDLASHLNLTEHPQDRDEIYVSHPMLAKNKVSWCLLIGAEDSWPESGGAMKVQLKLLGLREKPNASKVPDRGAVPTQQAPTIAIPGAAQSPNLIDVIPPGPAF